LSASPVGQLMRQTSRRLCPFVCLWAFGCAGVTSGPDSGLNATDTVAVAAPPGIVPKRPSKHWLRVSQYAICTDFEIDPTDPLFRDVESLPGQVQDELELPPGNNVIQVFLFDTQEKYEAYMTLRYPKLPTRRAYFIAEPRAASGDDLLVYTWMGDHLRTDLRHELTHAILHGVLKTVPLWLDEGLAGFFELPPDADGFSHAHHDVLAKGPFVPDLSRLETLGKVSQMEKPEYREAWAWVHLMLRGQPKAKAVLLAYVNDLRSNATPGSLRVKLKEALPEPEAALADHLAKAGRNESVGPVPAGR
jgi:hypothetical protein